MLLVCVVNEWKTLVLKLIHIAVKKYGRPNSTYMWFKQILVTGYSAASNVAELQGNVSPKKANTESPNIL